MDRFIAKILVQQVSTTQNLKSNMDRFIDFDTKMDQEWIKKFKIQYGQIYSEMGISDVENMQQFKIQYGQIYRNMQQGEIKVYPLFKIQYGQIYTMRTDVR